SEVIVAPFDLTGRKTFVALLGSVVVTETPADQLTLGDSVAFLIDDGAGGTEYHLESIANDGVLRRGKRVHAFHQEAVDKTLVVYKAMPLPFTGDIDDPSSLDELTLPSSDTKTKPGSVLLITTDVIPAEFYTVSTIDPMTGVATLDRDLHVNDPTA